jgi:serine/threonine protein kinase
MKGKRKEIVGGLRKKNAIDSFQAVLNMIRNPKTKITHISYSSKSGFIFLISFAEGVTIEESDIEFYGINDAKTAFDKPVHELILKILMIENRQGQLDPLYIEDADRGGSSKRYVKISETEENAKDEASVQNNIYINSVSPNGNPITPSVVDFSYFDNDSAKLFLNMISQKENTSNISLQMVNYLLNSLNNSNRKLAVITMECIDNTYTSIEQVLVDYEEHENRENTARYENTIPNVFAQMIRLFIQSKMINCDLNSENGMVNTDGSKVVLIDFGKKIDVFNIPPVLARSIKYAYNTLVAKPFQPQKDYILEDMIQSVSYTTSDFIKPENATEEQINEILEKIHFLIKVISTIDFAYNYAVFGQRFLDQTGFPQMNYLLGYIYKDGQTIRRLSNWIHSQVHPIYNETITAERRPRFVAIMEKYTDLFRGNQTFPKQMIQTMRQSNALFSMNQNTQYNRSEMVKSGVLPLQLEESPVTDVEIQDIPISNPRKQPREANSDEISPKKPSVPSILNRFPSMTDLSSSAPSIPHRPPISLSLKNPMELGGKKKKTKRFGLNRARKSMKKNKSQ